MNFNIQEITGNFRVCTGYHGGKKNMLYIHRKFGVTMVGQKSSLLNCNQAQQTLLLPTPVDKLKDAYRCLETFEILTQKNWQESQGDFPCADYTKKKQIALALAYRLIFQLKQRLLYEIMPRKNEFDVRPVETKLSDQRTVIPKRMRVRIRERNQASDRWSQLTRPVGYKHRVAPGNFVPVRLLNSEQAGVGKRWISRSHHLCRHASRTFREGRR
ncbi:hypothetical protein PHYBLDRAFT_172520 [Phycomyces blakesleeanus NRRL 1555(-)]|uniref:Uncharacterized protein n=1 Tax=Phycomyces blakesleeanus (strain ATCC 8743b / DSM 1359 / FGSC 10004 / NBRC 33097 / NRRL 1555) TaxID=763407 RepID=A0A167KZY1_PHYB8|nr:hypothetical protein PHYBLDRAFT_172520 [Phycomyces blakesleeanus NRRL 1555(-)]OAD69268.1 hypothetical protein PHYBLDRAFT_172520 [Phycomyces blakesleeanus NRRL 1555(-)]|eukprot:XP_018287308.1 hypothetical protein PHYBLDRAFT_172520 [Phycomyces blakesleeanus NRRL 1555(-)]